MAVLDSTKNEVQIISSAFHEAGHAVMLMKHGYQVSKVSVSFRNPGDGFTGRSKLKLYNPIYPGESFESIVSAWEFAIENIKKEMSIYLAGPIAESEFLGGQPLRLRGAEQDLLICQALVKRIDSYYDFYSGFGAIPKVSSNRILNNVHSKTRHWLRRKEIWKAISLLAQATSIKGELSAGEVNFLIGKVSEPGQLSLDLF